ncbi:hypothetical protein G6F60_006292 [Rhizopus arrhizus]|nr:hypothetical protein G6F60_006292 [Rhizopus arrhizus]
MLNDDQTRRYKRPLMLNINSLLNDDCEQDNNTRTPSLSPSLTSSPSSVSSSYSSYPFPNQQEDFWDKDYDDERVKAKRRRANGEQLEVLNRVFDRTFFPSTQVRAELGRQLGMSPRTVQIWFQNRRQAMRTKERQRLVRQSPVVPKKVAPFVVKRKQINFNLLDPVQPSSSPSLPPLISSQIHSSEPRQIYENLLKDKDEKIKELKTQLDELNKELSQTRHQCRLLENERNQFETSVIEKYAKEKEQSEIELRILKEMHIEKVQDLSTNLNHLSCTINSLRRQLQENNIKEEMREDDMISVNHIYKKDSQFIQDAYYQIKQEISNQQHPLWSNIQSTAVAIKNEIDIFQAWKSTSSIPIHELAKLVLKEQKSRKTLFGRRK